MFDIGFWELLVIAVIGLFVLGPERLPGAIRSVQRGMAQLRGFGSRMQAELNHELRVKELHENLKKIEEGGDIDNLSPELRRTLEELQQAAAQVNNPYASMPRTADEQPSGQSPENDPPRKSQPRDSE
ncbi:Sec-independent protein translocase protein TatB [Aliidiomarina celeris]|uniref:Sec-independent protein translocase protein TatB n=1 Tax=Aliidiomarina celeris TaxID=2249428 RepID=UPI000DE94E0D|nr:Sec-independent protein translocase protein TatB [Aliidiomarina celeris]